MLARSSSASAPLAASISPRCPTSPKPVTSASAVAPCSSRLAAQEYCEGEVFGQQRRRDAVARQDTHLRIEWNARKVEFGFGAAGGEHFSEVSHEPEAGDVGQRRCAMLQQDGGGATAGMSHPAERGIDPRCLRPCPHGRREQDAGTKRLRQDESIAALQA